MQEYDVTNFVCRSCLMAAMDLESVTYDVTNFVCKSSLMAVMDLESVAYDVTKFVCKCCLMVVKDLESVVYDVTKFVCKSCLMVVKDFRKGPNLVNIIIITCPEHDIKLPTYAITHYCNLALTHSSYYSNLSWA